MYADIDASEFPIIKVTFTGKAANEENFQIYLDGLKANYASRQPLAIIFDATKAALPGLAYQKMQAKWLKENEQLMKDYCRGTAYVIPNLVIRNVLKAIFALQKQPVDYLVCGNLSEARAWIEGQLETSLS